MGKSSGNERMTVTSQLEFYCILLGRQESSHLGCYSDVAFPEKYVMENFQEIFWKVSGNFLLNRKNVFIHNVSMKTAENFFIHLNHDLKHDYINLRLVFLPALFTA